MEAFENCQGPGSGHDQTEPDELLLAPVSGGDGTTSSTRRRLPRPLAQLRLHCSTAYDTLGFPVPSRLTLVSVRYCSQRCIRTLPRLQLGLGRPELNTTY